MSVAAQVVKKFINDPENVVPEALAGIAAAHPDLVRVDFEHSLVIRADAPVQGKVGADFGRRFRPRADARRVCRRGHARRRLRRARCSRPRCPIR